VQLRALIVDRNPDFGHLLQNLSTGLEITLLQSGARVAAAVERLRPAVAMVDLKAEFAETALAVLREERIPVLLNGEEPDGSEGVLELVRRFGVSRFLERPLPISELPSILRSVAALPVPEATSTRPVAPWTLDPTAWGGPEGVDSAPTSASTNEAPVAPWTRDPESWSDLDAPPPSTPTPPVMGDAEPTRSSPAQAQPPSATLIPPWERKPEQWAEMERPVAPWEASPSDWEEEPERVFHSHLERVNTKTLRRMTAIWVRKRTGTLSCEEQGVRIAFTDGAPRGKKDESRALDLLQQPNARLKFQAQGSAPNPARRAFGTELLHAALDLAKTDWVEANADKALQPVAHLDALRELPCGPAVFRVLESADGVLNLVDQLTALKLRLEQVDAYLGALDKMGQLEAMDVSVDPRTRRPRKDWVISRGYEGTDRRKAERRVDIERRQNRDRRRDQRRARQVRDSGDDRRSDDRRQGDRRSQEDRRKGLPMNPPPPRKKRKKRKKPKVVMPPPEAMGRLLQREWGLLEHADAWTVLGLPSTEAPKQVKRAGQRMLARYEPVVGDPRYDEASQVLARKISERVRWAVENARPLPEEPAAVVPRDELLFEEGRKSLLVQDYDTAIKCFRTAHKLAVEDPLYMGYYGWTLWKAADRLNDAQRERKQAEAEELLRLSDSLDHSSVPIQIFLARVELDLGQLARARARTKRLRDAGEESGQLDLLWTEVQKALAETDPGAEAT